MGAAAAFASQQRPPASCRQPPVLSHPANTPVRLSSLHSPSTQPALPSRLELSFPRLLQPELHSALRTPQAPSPFPAAPRGFGAQSSPPLPSPARGPGESRPAPPEETGGGGILSRVQGWEVGAGNGAPASPELARRRLAAPHAAVVPPLPSAAEPRPGPAQNRAPVSTRGAGRVLGPNSHHFLPGPRDLLPLFMEIARWGFLRSESAKPGRLLPGKSLRPHLKEKEAWQEVSSADWRDEPFLSQAPQLGAAPPYLSHCSFKSPRPPAGVGPHVHFHEVSLKYLLLI